MKVVNLKDAAEISNDLTRDELEMELAKTLGELAYEQDANRHLKELCADMFREHQRIYHTVGVLRNGPSVTNKQMAHWYSECMRWGIEVES